MMDLYSKCIYIFITLLYISVCSGSKRNDPSIRVTYTPKRFRSFEASVKLTFRFGKSSKQGNLLGQVIILKVFNKKKFVTAINTTLSANEMQLQVPCEVFARPGRYFIEYFIQGLTKTFISLTPRAIVVRRERIEIDVQKNHTAFDGPVSAWLSSKPRRCTPLKGKLKLYWIKNSKEHILVTTKIVNKGKIENSIRVNFRCKLFDTAGIFYFEFISDYNNKTSGKSQNMSVSWGKYEITAQSKNIFPCSQSFVVKFSSPYCDATEDKIEVRSTAYKKVLDSRVAFHAFKSVVFLCEVFKKHIREYCFDYVTESSLSKKRKIQTRLCVPSKKTEPRWTDWSEWSSWGSCTSMTGCGNGRKYRLRFCPLDSYPKSDDKSKCTGKRVEFMPCTLPPCKECKSCGCVFSTPGGTIVSPKSHLPLLSTTEKSSCQWFVQVSKGMKVKLWFDSLRLASNSSVIIRDGNSSNSEILKRITHDSERLMEDIYSTSNIVSIWYSISNRRIFNRRNSTGFQLSYASVEETKTSVSVMAIRSKSGTRRLAKMTFIGILAVLVVITFTIIAIIIVRIRRQRSNENTTKTVLSQRPSSSHTSTACVSESTIRSYYEPQLSADEGINNNSTSLSRAANYYHRPRLSTRTEHRPPVHVCPRCCTHAEHYPCEDNNDSNAVVGRQILYPDLHYGSNAENVPNTDRAQRVHSIIERRLSGASFVSEDFPQGYYPTYF